MKFLKKILTVSILLFGLSAFSLLSNNSHSAKLGYNVNAQPGFDEDMDDENENEAPIDNQLLVLPLAGIAVGAYFIRKRKKQTV